MQKIIKKGYLFLALLAVLLLVSCLTTTANVQTYVYNDELLLYPAVYQSIKDGAVKFKTGMSSVGYFNAAWLENADIYANKFKISDLYTVDGNTAKALLGALGGSSEEIQHYYFDLLLETEKGRELNFNYSNVRLESKTYKNLLPQDDLPSKGKTGVPTVVSFFNENIPMIMTDTNKYETAKKAALSDPEFLIAVLKHMTKLQREEFLRNELKNTEAQMNLKVVNVEKNTDTEYGEYAYYVFLTYSPADRSIFNNITVRLYTNDEKVTKLSKNMQYAFSGIVVGLKEGITSNILIIKN